MKKHGMGLLALCLIFSVFLAACGNQQKSSKVSEKSTNGGESIVVKLSHTGTPGSPKGQGASKFKKLLEKRSNGAFEVQIFPSSQLYSEKENIQQIQYNNIQMIIPSMTKLVGISPGWQIVNMPFLFKDWDSVGRFYDGKGGEMLGATLKNHGMKLLDYWYGGFNQFSNADSSIEKPSDFKGFKIRTQAGELNKAIYEAMGASAVVMPYAQVYTALETGVADGQENIIDNIYTQKYEEVQDYLTISNHGRLDYPVIVSSKFFEGLTSKQQTTFKKTLDDVTKSQRKTAKNLAGKRLKYFKQSDGIKKLSILTDQQIQLFKEAMKPVFDKFSGVIGKDLIELARKANKG
jgi:C4-dicarboxylate-binding protein DctP